MDQAEVIVSDDSKQCIAKELIQEKYSWVKWIEGPKKGPAANRNNGAKYATGDWFIFIDDDCEPQKDLSTAKPTTYYILNPKFEEFVK